MQITDQKGSSAKVAHLTSAHDRNDTRIFFKQCRSLVAHGYDVTLVVADDKGDAYADGVKVVDVGLLSGRLKRMFKTTQRVFEKAVNLDADIYHLHDPELIPMGLKLKHMGKQVIFDSHEDVTNQLLGKPYLDPVSRQLLSHAFTLFERYACRKFDGIVAATPFICNKFLKINPATVDISNFPLISEFDSAIPWGDKRNEVCYVGGISATRGIREIVRACEFFQSSTRLNLGGFFSEPELELEVKTYPGWTRVAQLGHLDRAGVRDVLGRSVAGLVTLHPLLNYLDALPVKMFEYMAAGIPVIASDFPLWREIVDGAQCGLCVDPLSPKTIAGAIDYLVSNPEVAQRMGENGRKAILEKYNWPIQAEKLTKFYAEISHGNAPASC